ncbi:MAG: hypothetical protein AB1765_07145 [Candidatus Hydrogenedentota bacterium]
MKPIICIFFSTLIVNFFSFNYLNAKDFYIKGKTDIRLINTGIDNENISGYPPDFSSEVMIDLYGKFAELDFKSKFEVIYDRFDSTKIKRMNLCFSKENLLVELGDVRASFSEFTLLNRELLGILYSQDFFRGGLVIDEDYKNNIRLQLLKIPLKRRENLEEILHLSRINIPYFYKNRLMLVLGQTEEDVELGEKIDFQNGRLSERVIFQQAGYGLRFESCVTSYVELALNLFAVEDDEKSLTRRIGPNNPITPILAKVGSLETRWKFLNDRWEFRTETARNEYNPNLYLGASNKRRDNAYKAELLSNTKIVDCDIELKRIEPNFYTAGNQSTLGTNDRQGLYSLFNIRPTKYNNFRLRINRYRDNLDANLNYTTTTSLYELNWYLNIPLWPSLTFTLRHNRENSTFAPSQITQTKKNYTNFYGINISYPIQYVTFNTFFSYVDYNDRNLYSINLARSDYDNRNFYTSLSLTPIKDLNLQIKYYRNSINFGYTNFKSIDRRGGIFASYNIYPDKLNATLETNYGKTNSQSYKITHKNLRLGFDLILSENDKILLEVKKDEDDYTPDDNIREYSATVGQIRYQRKF